MLVTLWTSRVKMCPFLKLSTEAISFFFSGSTKMRLRRMGTVTCENFQNSENYFTIEQNGYQTWLCSILTLALPISNFSSFL